MTTRASFYQHSDFLLYNAKPHSNQSLLQKDLQPLGIFITLMKYFFSYRKVMYSDLQTIAPEQYMKTITKRLTDLHAVSVSFLDIFR